MKVQDARVADMEDRNRAGVARPLDVAQSEAQAAASRAVAGQRRAAGAELPHDAGVSDRRSGPECRARGSGGCPPNAGGFCRSAQGARDNRQDIIAAQHAVEAARQQVTSALGQYYPTVTLNVDYYLSRQSFPTSSEWSGILQASLPIFDAGIIYEDVRNAWSLLRQARLNEMLTVRTVDQQVKTAYDNINASQRRIRELVTEVKASSDALFQAQQSYQAGLATNLDELTAQDQLLTAQLNLAAEQFNLKVYYLNLLRAMGKLLRPENIVPAQMPTAPTDFEVTTPNANARGNRNAPATQPAIQPTTNPAP